MLLNLNHAGRYGAYLPTGVARLAQLPEGDIYATITLGTACPQSWSADGFLLVTCSEMGACHGKPLPSSCPHDWVLHVHSRTHFLPNKCVTVLLCLP